MAVLISYYSGAFNDALTIGAIIGALAGIVVYTASSASEGVQRVLIGFLVGGLVMGLYQAVLVSQAAGVGGDSFNPLLQSRVGPFGSMLERAIILTVQAALVGGLLMVASLAPLRAIKGALLGVIIGSVAAVAAWAGLRLIETPVPLIIFHILVLGLVMFIMESLPVRNR